MAFCLRGCRSAGLVSAGTLASARNQALLNCRNIRQTTSSGLPGPRCSDEPGTPGRSPGGQQRSAGSPVDRAARVRMKPQLEVVGSALQQVHSGLNSKVASVPHTMRLYTLWGLTISLVKNLGFGEPFSCPSWPRFCIVCHRCDLKYDCTVRSYQHKGLGRHTVLPVMRVQVSRMLYSACSSL